jgi:hypothetical protein
VKERSKTQKAEKNENILGFSTSLAKMHPSYTSTG